MEQTVDIAAMPEKVWSVMIDVECWPEWTTSVSSIELLDGPPLVVGSRVRVRQPRLPAAVWTVTALEAERYFEWRSVAAGLTSTGGHRIDRIGGDRTRPPVARLEWVVDATDQSGLWWVVPPLCADRGGGAQAAL